MSPEKKPRLGRGLDALLGGGESAAAPGADGSRLEAPLATIEKSPFQPRKNFDDDEIKSLCESIKTHGVLQPLLVRQVGERYQLIAGERRLRAAEAAGLRAVPISIVDFNDQQSYEAALVENIQRADLNPIEKAIGFRDYLHNYQMTHEQLAARLGLGRTTITNLVALLDLPDVVQTAIRNESISLGHAKALKSATDAAQQIAVCKEIITMGLSVNGTTAYIKQLQEGPEVAEVEKQEKEPSGGGGGGTKAPPVKTAHVASIEDELRQKLGMKVDVQVKGKDKGRLIFAFESNDDFERLIEVLRK